MTFVKSDGCSVVSAGLPASPNSTSNEETKEKSDAMPNISDVMLRKLKLHRGLPGWCVTNQQLLKLTFTFFDSFSLPNSAEITFLTSQSYCVHRPTLLTLLTVPLWFHSSAPPLTEKEVEVGIWSIQVVEWISHIIKAKNKNIMPQTHSNDDNILKVCACCSCVLKALLIIFAYLWCIAWACLQFNKLIFYGFIFIDNTYIHIYTYIFKTQHIRLGQE